MCLSQIFDVDCHYAKTRANNEAHLNRVVHARLQIEQFYRSFIGFHRCQVLSFLFFGLVCSGSVLSCCYDGGSGCGGDDRWLRIILGHYCASIL